MKEQSPSGDVVEVKSPAKIIGTLDERGMLDGLPFTPEMLRCYGRQFVVSKRAEKVCIYQASRRILGTVLPGRVSFRVRLVADDACPDKRSYRVSFEKIRRKLPAIKPQWDVRTVAEHLYRAYHSSGLTLDDFEGPRYQRIKKPMPTKYLMLICGTRGPGATVKQRQSSALSGDS